MKTLHFSLVVIEFPSLKVRHLLEQAYSLSQEWGGIPVVVAGDFNSVPQVLYLFSIIRLLWYFNMLLGAVLYVTFKFGVGYS